MEQPDTGDLHVDDSTSEVPASPLQALRLRLGRGFSDAMSQADIDHFIARRKAQKGRHRAD